MRIFAKCRARPWPERPVSAVNKSGNRMLHREASSPVRGASQATGHGQPHERIRDGTAMRSGQESVAMRIREFAIGAACLGGYYGVRRLVWNDRGRRRAARNADRVVAAEERLGLRIEPAVQRAALRHRRVVDMLNLGYAVGNLAISAGWLIRAPQPAQPRLRPGAAGRGGCFRRRSPRFPGLPDGAASQPRRSGRHAARARHRPREPDAGEAVQPDRGDAQPPCGLRGGDRTRDGPLRPQSAGADGWGGLPGRGGDRRGGHRQSLQPRRNRRGRSRRRGTVRTR